MAAGPARAEEAAAAENAAADGPQVARAPEEPEPAADEAPKTPSPPTTPRARPPAANQDEAMEPQLRSPKRENEGTGALTPPDEPEKKELRVCQVHEDEDPGAYFDGSFELPEDGRDDDYPGLFSDDNPLVQEGMKLEIERFIKFKCFEVLTEAQAAEVQDPIRIGTRWEKVW